MVYFLVFLIIVVLILTNAITDAPNAISTLVGTKVMPFKKAAHLSAVFNLIGILVMSFTNISVANCISSMVNLNDGIFGIIALGSAMISVILFSLIALKFGIPTSETHGLIAALTGSSIAIYSLNSINFSEWKNVLIGLIWSILGTYVISISITKIFMNLTNKFSNNKVKQLQILGCLGMSFMHGAQDGQKFIGVLIIFISLFNKVAIPEIVNPLDYVGIIIFTAIIMAIGVSIGGKKIVDNIGSEMATLNNKQALFTDISTVATLFIASLTGLPVSTTHAKTVSIVGISNVCNIKTNGKIVKNIIKAWIWTFPICGIVAYVLTTIIRFAIIYS